MVEGGVGIARLGEVCEQRDQVPTRQYVILRVERRVEAVQAEQHPRFVRVTRTVVLSQRIPTQ